MGRVGVGVRVGMFITGGRVWVTVITLSDVLWGCGVGRVGVGVRVGMYRRACLGDRNHPLRCVVGVWWG